jgi:branched-chain amino acid transport system ATP-binding protein
MTSTTGHLVVDKLTAAYGDIVAVRDVSLTVEPGQVLLVLGRNGAGKTTLLNAIAGLLPSRGGTVSIDGSPVQKMAAHMRAAQGIGFVQAGKRVFGRMSVEQNLELGFYSRRRGDRAEMPQALERAFERFPLLRERRKSAANSLSGGQQQMLAIGQALMPDPQVLMLDEPSAGLAPVIVQELMTTISGLRAEGKGVLLVEQAVFDALPIADSIAILEHGEVAISGPASEVGDVSEIQDVYLGSATEG